MAFPLFHGFDNRGCDLDRIFNRCASTVPCFEAVYDCLVQFAHSVGVVTVLGPELPVAFGQLVNRFEAVGIDAFDDEVPSVFSPVVSVSHYLSPCAFN